VAYVSNSIRDNDFKINKDVAHLEYFVENVQGRSAFSKILDHLDGLEYEVGKLNINTFDTIRDPIQIEKCSIKEEEVISSLRYFVRAEDLLTGDLTAFPLCDSLFLIPALNAVTRSTKQEQSFNQDLSQKELGNSELDSEYTNENPLTLISIGYKALEEGDSSFALEVFQRALSIEPSVEAHTAMGTLHEALGDLVKAEGHYSHILDSFPHHAQTQAKLTALRNRRDALFNAIDNSLVSRQFEHLIRLFKDNYAEAQRHPRLLEATGKAYFSLGKSAEALQYFQQASYSQVLKPEILALMARCYEFQGDYEHALSFSSLAYTLQPQTFEYFDLYRSYLSIIRGDKLPHWLVLADSHGRYFQYMQANQPRFFRNRLFLEAYQFGGATAYGISNYSSRSGARKKIQSLYSRMNAADRVLINFGEIDCRRAAWKASAASGKSIEELIIYSAKNLIEFVEKEVLPHQPNVTLIGAKPQIVCDDDFYKLSIKEERTFFKPKEERQRVSFLYNSYLLQSSKALGLTYIDIDDQLSTNELKDNFFRSCYFDDYDTDTHGNIDFFARLYYSAFISSGMWSPINTPY
jgi:tetratricopeptide (TPR) repeat protein